MKIEVIQPKFDNRFYEVRANEAITYLERTRTSDARKKALQVLAGLCRQAYLKGRHDMKRELNG